MQIENRTQLGIEGMTCSACARRVSDALRRVDGVEAVDVDLRGASADVRHAATTSKQALADAVSRAGYGAHLVR